MAELELCLITEFRVFGVFRGSLFIREDSRYSWSVFLGSGSAGLGEFVSIRGSNGKEPRMDTNQHEFSQQVLRQ